MTEPRTFTRCTADHVMTGCLQAGHCVCRPTLESLIAAEMQCQCPQCVTDKIRARLAAARALLPRALATITELERQLDEAFPAPPPQPGDDVDTCVRKGALRHLHDVVAAVTLKAEAD